MSELSDMWQETEGLGMLGEWGEVWHKAMMPDLGRDEAVVMWGAHCEAMGVRLDRLGPGAPQRLNTNTPTNITLTPNIVTQTPHNTYK